MIRGIPKDGVAMKGRLIVEKMTEIVMEGVMGRRQRVKMEERMRREMTVTPMLDGQRPWQRSWGRKPLREKPASW